MRSMRERCRAGALVLAASLALPARAEVAAEVDAFGTYVRTVVIASSSSKSLKIWSPARGRTLRLPLNVDGDLRGDLYPVILESPVNRQPWVIWSRWNGADYDLAWSRFVQGAWTAVLPLLDARAPGADLDPSMAFNDLGRAHVAWWRDEEGTGRVYLSMWLSSEWMAALPISDEGVDSRYPVVSVLPDRRIRVVFETPQGTVGRIVAMNSGATITDDINPFDELTVTNDPTSLR